VASEKGRMAAGGPGTVIYSTFIPCSILSGGMGLK